jgi:hypothetical protein
LFTLVPAVTGIRRRALVPGVHLRATWTAAPVSRLRQGTVRS